VSTAFLLLAYGWAWLVWIPAVIIHRRTGGEFSILIVAIGAWGPTIAGVVVTAFAKGGAGVRRLLRKCVEWRVPVVWYVAALLAPSIPTVVLAAFYVLRGGAIGPPDVGRLATLPVIALSSLPLGPMGEELGWRGFLLPRVAGRFNLLGASVLVGIIWTFWHAPLFWAPSGSLISGAPVTLQSVAVFVAIVTGLSCLFAWVWRHARGSVLLTMLMHLWTNMNVPGTVFPGLARMQQQRLYASIGLLWLLILVVVVADLRTWTTPVIDSAD
jgi:hypothetical protein